MTENYLNCAWFFTMHSFFAPFFLNKGKVVKRKNILFFAALSVLGLRAMSEDRSPPSLMPIPENPNAQPALERSEEKASVQKYSMKTHDMHYASLSNAIDRLDIEQVQSQDPAFVAAYQQQYCLSTSIFGDMVLASADPKSIKMMEILLKKGAAPRGVIRFGNLDMFNDVGLVLDTDPVFTVNLDPATRYAKLLLLLQAGCGPVARIQQHECDVMDYVRERYANQFSAEQIESLQAAYQAGHQILQKAQLCAQEEKAEDALLEDVLLGNMLVEDVLDDVEVSV